MELYKEEIWCGKKSLCQHYIICDGQYDQGKHFACSCCLYDFTFSLAQAHCKMMIDLFHKSFRNSSERGDWVYMYWFSWVCI